MSLNIEHRSNARLAIVQALYQMEVAGKGLNEIFAEFETHWIGREIEGAQYKPAEIGFFREILQGVIEDQVQLDLRPQARPLAALSQPWRDRRNTAP